MQDFGFVELTKEKVLPMYIKLKKVMNKYKDKLFEGRDDYFPVSMHTTEILCKQELNFMGGNARYFGIDEVCFVALQNVPGAERSPCIDLYVSTKHRNKGYGTNLVRFCKTLSDKLYLTVLKNNTKALGLYQSEGFQIDEEDDELIRMSWEKDHNDWTGPSLAQPESFSSLMEKLRSIR